MFKSRRINNGAAPVSPYARTDDLGAFKAVLTKLVGKQATVAVYDKPEGRTRRSSKFSMSVEEALGFKDFPLDCLLVELQDGFYEVDVCDAKKSVHGIFEFAVGDQKKARKARAQVPDGPHSSLSGGSGNNGTVQSLFGLVQTMLAGTQGQGLSALSEAVKLLKETKGDNDVDLQAKLLEYALGGQRDSGGGDMQMFLQGLEMGKSLQPNIEQDGLMNMLAGIVPLLGQFMAARSGVQAGPGQQPPQAPPQPLAPPGQTSPQAPQSTPNPPQAGETLQPQGAELAGADPRPTLSDVLGDEKNPGHEWFYKLSVAPFRQMVAQGQTAENIRNGIINLVSISLDSMPGDPHPLVADLGKMWQAGNFDGLNAALSSFFGAIPELAADTGLQAEIKASFFELAGGGLATGGLDDTDNANIGTISEDGQDEQDETGAAVTIEGEPDSPQHQATEPDEDAGGGVG